jgi:CIC family chloride channel protein
VGAVFHSSIGGGLFAVEIVQKAEMKYRDLFPAILSSSVAVFVSKAFGWKTFYAIHAVREFMDIDKIAWLVLLAMAAGLLGKSYTGLYVVISRLLKRDDKKLILVKVLIGTTLASALAWLVNPNLFGTSKQLIQAIFSDERSILYGHMGATLPIPIVLVIMIVVKAIANCLTVGSGMSAGFTGPAAILGMLLGSALASLVGISPQSANYAAFVAAGFSGLLASSMNIPLAAAVMSIECFGLHYSFPAGLAAIVGFQINRHYTIYDYAFKAADSPM